MITLHPHQQKLVDALHSLGERVVLDWPSRHNRSRLIKTVPTFSSGVTMNTDNDERVKQLLRDLTLGVKSGASTASRGLRSIVFHSALD